MKFRTHDESSCAGSRQSCAGDDDDDVYYYIGERPKLEGETENMGVCTKERKGITAEMLKATPCTKSLGGEIGGRKHGGDVGRRLCCKFAAVFARVR